MSASEVGRLVVDADGDPGGDAYAFACGAASTKKA